MKGGSMNNKKMKLEDRLVIESYIEASFPFSTICEKIHFSYVAVSQEIKKYSIILPAKEIDHCYGRLCQNRFTCEHHKTKHRCPKRCSNFLMIECPKLKFQPFSCNGCPNLETCILERKIYSAVDANYVAEYNREIAHKGPQAITVTELKRINELVSPLIKKGLSIKEIYNKYHNSFNFSERTLRNYIKYGILDARAIDLRRTIVRKYSSLYKKRDKNQIKDASILVGRTYECFKKFIKENETVIFEVDTVIGKKSDKYCILTIFERKSRLQVGFKVRRTALSIFKVFEKLRLSMGAKSFYELLQVLLTDNGLEFNLLHEIEKIEGLDFNSKVFFCNPYSSFQKGGCERNHEFIRYVYPKGTSFDELTQENISALFSNINSYPRPSLNHSTPFKMFLTTYKENAEKFLNFFSIKEIKFEDLKIK